MSGVTGRFRSTLRRVCDRAFGRPIPPALAIVVVSYSKRLTLLVFATVILRGLVAGADFGGTLRSALLAMPAFLVIGLLCAEIARRVVEERVEQEFQSPATATVTPPSTVTPSPVPSPPPGDERS